MKDFFKLFVVPEDGTETTQKEKKSQNISFPQKQTDYSHTPSNGIKTITEEKTVEQFKQITPNECGPYLGQIMEMYEKGFESLNRPGIEFYEFFEAVVEGGITEPFAYKMAFKILGKQEPSMSKESLLKQSQFYITELNKVHDQYKNQGETKRSSIEDQCSKEIDLTSQEIDSLTKQIESLQKQIDYKKQILSETPKKYATELKEIDCKLMANEEAANRIIKNIQTVISGINSNL